MVNMVRNIQNRLRKFAARHPDLCKLKDENKELGSVSYTVQKSRVSIHLNSPQSEAKRKAASERAKQSDSLEILEKNKVQPGT